MLLIHFQHSLILLERKIGYHHAVALAVVGLAVVIVAAVIVAVVALAVVDKLHIEAFLEDNSAAVPGNQRG